MTKQSMFAGAHKQASIEARQFGVPYREAFASALRGFHMVAAGYRGVQIIEPSRVWA